MIKICKQCNNEFLTYNNKRLFCSRSCYTNSMGCTNTFNDLRLNSKDIIEKYESGLSSTIIAKKYDTGHGNILKILEENNIHRRDRKKVSGSQVKNKRELDRVNSYTNDVLKLYRNGYSIPKIANKLKIAHSSVRRLLKDNKIEIRKQGFYQEGNKSAWWKGGNKEFELLYNITDKQWRKISKNIQKRDNHICQKCGDTRKLNVHHIIPARYADTMAKNDYENLITLCDSCHMKIEPQWHNYVEPFRNYLTKIYGYQNYPVDFYKAMQKAELV